MEKSFIFSKDDDVDDFIDSNNLSKFQHIQQIIEEVKTFYLNFEPDGAIKKLHKAPNKIQFYEKEKSLILNLMEEMIQKVKDLFNEEKDEVSKPLLI